MTDLPGHELLDQFNAAVHHAIASTNDDADRTNYRAHKARLSMRLNESKRLLVEASSPSLPLPEAENCRPVFKPP